MRSRAVETVIRIHCTKEESNLNKGKKRAEIGETNIGIKFTYKQ